MKVNGPQRSINQRDARATRINDSREELFPVGRPGLIATQEQRGIEQRQKGATAISRASAHRFISL